MADVIGAAVIEVTADSSGLTAGIAQANTAMKSLGTTAQTTAQQTDKLGTELDQTGQQSAELSREQQRLISTINNYSNTVGKTRGEVLEFRAAQAGVSSQVQAQITAIKAQEAALKSNGAELNKYGQSAKQTAAALRGVPAQVTDIITSLQGGQAPLTVLLQQGGQLKDMFGGVVPAARALGGAIIGLINPLTVTIAAFAALAVAYAKGSSEQDAYNKALITTGGIAGKTADQLADMARSIDANIGTTHDAAEALAALAGTGQVAGNNLEKFAETAVRAQKYIGASIEDTAKSFAELGKDPVRASEKLNESMNYLTLAVYDQIKAAKENGDEQRAADIAQNAYADALDQRANRLKSSLGVFQRAWQALSADAKEAWDQILGIGRPQTLGEGLAAAQERLQAVQRAGFPAAPVQAEINDRSRAMVRQMDAAAAEADRVRTEKEKINARKRTDDLAKSTRDRAAIRKDEIDSYKRDAALLGITTEQQAKQIAAINAKYKDPKGPAAKAFQDDAGTKYLMQLRETEASLSEQLSTSEKLTASQRELAKFEKQIADLKEKKQLTADQKSLLASQDAIIAQLKKNVAIEDEIKAREKATKELEKQKEFLRQIDAINATIASGQDSRNDQYARELGGVGQGDRARREIEAQRNIRREFERYQLQLNKQAAEKNQLGSAEYLEEVERIKSALDEALRAQQGYFDALRAAQANWRNGANEAIANYLDEVANAAGRAQQFLSDAFRGGNTALADALWEGNWKSFEQLGDRLGKQLLEGILSQQVTGPLAKGLQGLINDKDSIIGKTLGGLFGTSDTGESWLGALGLGGGAGSERGSSIVNPLYVQSVDSIGFGGGSGSADAIGGIISKYGLSSANSGGGDSGIWSWVGSLFGRAGGGGVNAGRMYQVNENGPELLTVGNRSMLMMGNQNGRVTPMSSSDSRPINVNVNQTFAPGTNRGTTQQAALQAGREIQRSMARNG